MGIQAGARLGIYEVVSLLGTGGMGEVYRARDTKLGRDVALKVLPGSTARDPQRMARFEREAKTLASLNHPNIAAVYGLEESGDVTALVMELVEGETLADRIARSSHSHTSLSGSLTGSSSHLRLQAEESLNIAKQIAEALEYAHEHGVVHRDLKPANVKITPDGSVKVLDFGLAKVLSNDPSASMDPSNSPTISMMATQAGIILGTAAYMPPEQAKGKQVDRRADIWAFGCVLYELLTGKRAFDGETITDILAAVVRGEPDWKALPADTPQPIRNLLSRCLKKDPKQRLRDIGDARFAIEETISGADAGAVIYGSPDAAAGRRSLLRQPLFWIPATLAIVFASIAVWLLLQPRPAKRVIQFAVDAPDNTTFGASGLSISPDGQYVAFAARKDNYNTTDLWLRPLDSLTATEIPGTDAAGMPFWSPNSQWIGFQANGKLEKVAVSGGPPIMLCDMRNFSLPYPTHVTEGTWNRDGVILFTNPGGVYQVPDSGGAPALVAGPDAFPGESGPVLPSFLPDGRHFLVLTGQKTGPDVIALGSLDSKGLKKLGPATSNAIFAPPGFVLYVDQTTLMARPFDTRRLRFTGPAIPIAQNVAVNTGPQQGFFSVSRAGILAYRASPGMSTNEMVWFNREGKALGTVGGQDVFTTPALSPDGTKLAVAVGQQPSADIWIDDLKRGTSSRLTFNAAYDVNPIWSSDGSQIYFSSARSKAWGIFKKAADGLGATEPVLDSGDQNKSLNDLTSDGRYAIYDSVYDPVQLWVLPLFGDRKPFAYVQGSFNVRSAQFSPNGHYVAYASYETGRWEVYVQTFPQHTGRWEISTAGGEEPTWRRDGKELYYLTPDGTLMAVDVNTSSAAFQAGTPKALFKPQLIPLSYWRNIYVPSPDGQRFLMVTPAAQTKPAPVTVVVNWQSLLKR